LGLDPAQDSISKQRHDKAIKPINNGNDNDTSHSRIKESKEIKQLGQDAASTSAKMDPRDAEMWNRQGLNFARKELFRDALECFETALRASPNHQKAWYNKGVTLMKLQGGDSEALRCFNRSLDLETADAGAWYCKGVVLTRLGNLRDSIPCFERAIEIDPYHAAAWYQRGVASRQMGYKKQADEFFKKARQLGLK